MKNPTVKIRIMGDPDVVQDVLSGLNINENIFYKEVSRPYPNRNGNDIRVYVTVTAGAQYAKAVARRSSS